MSETTTQEGPEREATPEEIEAYYKEMLEYNKKQIEMLTTQAEVEKLKADIAEHRTRGYLNYVRLAQLKLGPPKETAADAPEETSSKEEGGKKRSLKKPV